MNFCTYESPVGRLAVCVENCRIVRLCPAEELDFAGLEFCKDKTAAECCRQLDEYFSGKRKEFDLPLAPEGTEFQRLVWNALRDIPYGKTISYGQLAESICRPGAARAVGGANNKNPILILIPCHRVIGRDGSLTGYAAGIGKKEFLLKLEGAIYNE